MSWESSAQALEAMEPHQQRTVLREVLHRLNPHPAPPWMDEFSESMKGNARWRPAVLALFWTGGILALLSHIPQIARPLALRDAHEISLLFLVMTAAALLLQVVYSLMLGAAHNVIMLSITFLLYLALIGIKVWLSYTHCDPQRKALDRSRFSPLVQRFLFGTVTTHHDAPAAPAAGGTWPGTT
jgi:uncharacterized protein with PQ loop repeat